jgi:hypothetical protein
VSGARPSHAKSTGFLEEAGAFMFKLFPVFLVRVIYELVLIFVFGDLLLQQSII